jgi:FkbM family methyltransferase
MNAKVAAKRLTERFGYELRKHPERRRAAHVNRLGTELVIDVGAAHGQTGLALRRNGYRGQIVSFEPLAEAFAGLQHASAHDDGWTAHRVALGTTDGSTTIHVAANSDSSSVLPMSGYLTEIAPHVREVNTATVSTARLDSFDLGGVPTFLKLDVQGLERAVLDGARVTMPSVVGLQIELSLVSLYDGSPDFDEMYPIIRSLGFSLVDLEPGFRDPGTGQLLQFDGIFER